MQIVITDCDHGFISPEKEIIEGAGHQLCLAECRTAEEVVEVAQWADAIICQYAPITAYVLDALQACRVVGRYGVGVDNIDVPTATRLGKKVISVPDFCVQEVADHTLALILALTRRVVLLHDRIRADSVSFAADWPGRFQFVGGMERSSKQVVGIVGLGRIGRAVAERLKAFGFRLVGYDPYVEPDKSGMKMDSLKQLLQDADIVTIHTPLTEKTRGLIGERELGLMKPTAVLVNASRGAIIDEPALTRALQERRLAGAGLDVLTIEPFPADHPLLQMENVILTPHVAFYSETSVLDLKTRVARYVLDALAESKAKGEITNK